MTGGDPVFWTHRQTAEQLGIKTGTLYDLLSAKKGPPSYKLGRLRRYDPAEVRKWSRTLRDPTSPTDPEIPTDPECPDGAPG